MKKLNRCENVLILVISLSIIVAILIHFYVMNKII